MPRIREGRGKVQKGLNNYCTNYEQKSVKDRRTTICEIDNTFLNTNQNLPDKFVHSWQQIFFDSKI